MLGRYNGIEVHECTLNEYFAMTSAEKNSEEKIYMIIEDRNAIRGGKLFGTIREDLKRLDEVPQSQRLSYTVVYGKQWRAWKKRDQAQASAELELL